MSFDVNKLYSLLPALYRIRDTELGIAQLTEQEKQDIEDSAESLDQHAHGPIKSLLSIIAEQIAVLEENLDQLYDDQFIETCAEWTVAYISKLVGTKGLIEIPGTAFSQRAEVANTIGYRRRKGTASIIEQLARDVTNWNANVVEYFQLLATTQYMNHPRLSNLAIAEIRNWEKLAYNTTPFDRISHTVDVRRITSNRGKYNIQNIGIYLWRINSYKLSKVPAYKVDDRRYRFDPLGKDSQLYHLPETEEKITHLAEPINVPMPISRRLLLNKLDTYYGKDKSLLVYADDQEVVISSTTSPTLEDLMGICNLSDLPDGTWANMPKDKIAIDPILGRVAFPASEAPPEKVHVSFHYGFSSELGGGEYDRSSLISDNVEQIIEVQAGGIGLQNALNQLEATGGVVEIIDNETYLGDIHIKIAEGKTLELRVANQKRPLIVIIEELLIEGGANSKVILNGLVIHHGQVRLPETLQTVEKTYYHLW